MKAMARKGMCSVLYEAGMSLLWVAEGALAPAQPYDGASCSCSQLRPCAG